MDIGKMAFIWVVRAVLMIDALLLLSLPARALLGGSDLAGDAMAKGYAVLGALLGGVVVGGLALAWRAVTAGWAIALVALLIALVTVFLFLLLFV